jgi:hypothetical protein
MCEFDINTIACDGFSQMNRRRWLGLSTSAAVSTSLASTWLTLAAERIAMGQTRPKTAVQSMIFLWLQGGPSQLETFDPHAGSMIGGDTQAIQTSLKGIQFASSLPRLAEIADQFTVIRSMVSKEGDHERATYHVKTGWRPDPTLIHPSIGAVLCHQLTDEVEIPRHISILPGLWGARGGYLGSRFDAFQTGDPKFPLPNLDRVAAHPKLNSKLSDLEFMEKNFARGRQVRLRDSVTAHQSATDRAVRMMSSEQIRAFDINEESNSVIKSFGDSGFGRGCLAAVRLVEQGVRCIEIELSGWDTHANNHELQYARAAVLDEAFAALVAQLKERGLWEKTLVVCGGEFGRTPKINPLGGRDHWPHGFSVVLGGGPIRRGYVHGATDTTVKENINNKTEHVADLVDVPDFHASLLHAMGIDGNLELQTPIGRPLNLSFGKPVPQFFAS